MKPKLKINFADFYPKLDEKDNYFFNLLSSKYDLEISSKPEVLFCTCYFHEKFKYSCLKIYYTPENVRPNFDQFDFAMSFDFVDNPRHYRLPLYIPYIGNAESERLKGRIFNPFSKIESISDTLCRYRTEDEARIAWRAKKKFCCILNSNSHAKFRLKFVDKLSQYKLVASGGKVNNNVGGPIVNKIDFIKDYRFVFAMENTSVEGYTTEKIIEPFFIDSIPLYWGNPLVNLDFNTKAFLNYHDYENEEAYLERIIEIDKNEDLAIHILMQPKFPDGLVNKYADSNNVLTFLMNAINNRHDQLPIGKTLKGRWLNSKSIMINKKNQLSPKIKKLVKWKGQSLHSNI